MQTYTVTATYRRNDRINLQSKFEVEADNDAQAKCLAEHIWADAEIEIIDVH